MITHSASRQRGVAGAALITALVALAFPVACNDSNTTGLSETKSPPPTAPRIQAGALVGQLPSTDTVTSAVPAFEIKQKGGGIAGRFEVTNSNSAAIALDAVNSGNGHGLLAWNLGLGRGAVIITSNSRNLLPALDVSSQSVGSSTHAAAADVRANNTASAFPAMSVSHLGTGTVLQLDQKGASGDVAVFQVGGVNVARIDHEGRGWFNGGTRSKGADVAEIFQVSGNVRSYEPGDVLVISATRDRMVEKSAGAYSTLVAGVYATQPGVILSEVDVDTRVENAVPLGVVGVIPTKVSAENGPIHRGDLLVTARTSGHAMRATDQTRTYGAVLGKALQEFKGPGTGMIRVLVNVQ